MPASDYFSPFQRCRVKAEHVIHYQREGFCLSGGGSWAAANGTALVLSGVPDTLCTEKCSK